MARGKGRSRGTTNLVIFKSQLQEYTQKAAKPSPIYQIIKEGLPHEPKFRASVFVNGSMYYSPPGFPNVKAAEHAAAQAALEGLVEANGTITVPNPVHETGLCKNLLQEYAQKLNIPLPSYSCVNSGEIHSPIFSSTVEVAGISYSGGAARTKKEAEIKAARTALLAIQAQSCSSGSQAAVVNTVSSQVDLYSSKKRERDSEQSSKEMNAAKPKMDMTAVFQSARTNNGKDGILVGNPSMSISNGQERLTAIYAPEATLVEIQQEPCAMLEHAKQQGSERRQKELRTKGDREQQQGIHASNVLLNNELKEQNSNHYCVSLPQVKEEEQKKQGGGQQTFPTSETVHVG